MESVSLKYNNAGVKTCPSLQFLPEPEIFDKGRQNVKCKIFTARHETNKQSGRRQRQEVAGRSVLLGHTGLCCTAHTSSFKLFSLFAAA